MDRRHCLLAGAAWCAVALPALAQTAPPAAAAGPTPMRAVGLFSLLGDTLDVSTAEEPAASRMDRTTRQVLRVNGIGFDRVVATEVRQHFTRHLPTVHLRMFGAASELALADQQRLAEQARRGMLPGFMIDAAQQHQLTHLLIATRDRAEGAAETAGADTFGRVELEGVGFHVDMLYKVIHVDTQDVVQGALVPHAIVRLTLFDVERALVQRSQIAQRQWLVAPRKDRKSDGPWGLLNQEEKVRAAREAVGDAVRQSLPALFAAG